MSDGPYSVISETEEETGATWWMIKGPGIIDPRNTATQDKDEALTSASIRNSAYAAGRASLDGLVDAARRLITEWRHGFDSQRIGSCVMELEKALDEQMTDAEKKEKSHDR